MESVPLTTADGVALDADLRMPEAEPVGGVVVCHPHPQFGGDRFHPVVDAVFTHLPTLGFVSLRFDFRPEFGGGVDERRDVVAALDALQRRTPRSLFAVGYSFGAVVALSTPDARVRGVIAVAPPLAMSPVDPPTVPTLVLTPRHDQFGPPDVVESVVADWPDCDHEIVESSDHFLVGHARAVAAAAGSWLTRQR